MDRAKELELYQSLLLQKKKRGLEDLFFFNKFIVESNPQRRLKLVDHVHGEWGRWYHNSQKRIKMILVPRGTFKSTFFTVGRSLQKIAANRNERILLTNATGSNADRFLGEIQDHIKRNEEFKLLYGDMFNPKLKWNENEIVVDGRDLGSKEATITTIGVGGNLVSQHYSTIIADDLVNLENSDTRLQANKVIEWWKRSFSLLDRDGEMIIIGTRWAYYELYQYIIDNLGDQVDFYIRSAYNPDKSLYFPEELTEKKLQELKKLHGSYVFSAFYLNNPVDYDSAIIKQSMLKYFKNTPKLMHIFTMCDPAVSQATKADYSTIVVAGITVTNDWYLLEVRRDKWTVGELISNLFSVNNDWKPMGMTVEVIGAGAGLEESIQNEEDLRNIYLPITYIKSRNNVQKEQRIRSILQPRFERGKIYIKEDMMGREDFEEEVLNFPRSRHDDIIDPLTDLDMIGFAPTPDEAMKNEPKSIMEQRMQKKIKSLQNPDLGKYDEDLGEYY